MCDTISALPDSTVDGKLIMAKNSDRSPNEPHIMVFVPAADHADGDMLKATYIELPQAAHTNAVVLFKPSWIWGAEMGYNEYGVNIGNEAVFTKVKRGGDSLTGMDFVRLALERASDAETACAVIIELLEQYGQGGNCGYDHEFYYDNSFMIADAEKAIVLETAGRLWAKKYVKEFGEISNCLSIQKDFDDCSDEIKKSLRRRGFTDRYDKKLYLEFSGALSRRLSAISKLVEAKYGTFEKTLASALLTNKGGKFRDDATLVSDATLRSILTLHAEDAGNAPYCASVTSVCMHYGKWVGDHTTGSYIAHPADGLYWVTGCSTPCLSLFKPVFSPDVSHYYAEDEDEKAITYWLRREVIQRNLLSKNLDIAEYREELKKTQADIDSLVADYINMDEKARIDASARAFELEEEFVSRWLARCEKRLELLNPRGGLLFKKRWKQKNAELCKNHGALLSEF